VTPVDLAPWPVIRAYQARLHERPSVARAFSEELELYRKEVAHHAALQGPSKPATTAETAR
jgi:glutathione S-transferase